MCYIYNGQSNEGKTKTNPQQPSPFSFLELTGMNAKKNLEIGNLAENVLVAIEQEKNLNQDIHNLKGSVSSNVGKIIEEIINERPDI